MTQWGWKAPSTIVTTGISVIKTEAPDDLSSKLSSKRLPAVLDGIDKAEALPSSCQMSRHLPKSTAMGLAPPSRSSSGLGQNRSIHGPLGCLSQASFIPTE